MAARFQLSRRRDKLTWGHHAEVTRAFEFCDRSQKVNFVTDPKKAEIKLRATRRIGEINDAEKQAGKQAKGAREQGTRRAGLRGALVTPRKEQNLASRGVDKHLAKRAPSTFPRESFAADERLTKSEACFRFAAAEAQVAAGATIPV